MALGMPVLVTFDFGGFEGFGILGIGGFDCPTVFVGFDFFFGLASLDLRRVSKAFARKLADLRVRCSEWLLGAQSHLTEIFVLSVKTGGV